MQGRGSRLQKPLMHLLLEENFRKEDSLAHAKVSYFFFFFITLGLELSDTKVYEP